MKTSTAVLIVSSLLSVLMANSVFADRDRDDRHKGFDRQQKSERQAERDSRSRDVHKRDPRPDIRYDRRIEHKRHYPKEGVTIRVLPKKRHIIHYRNHDYYYWEGVWYSPVGVNFVVVRPPLGIIVPILPPYYTTIWFGDIPYYYVNDVYYIWRADLNGYEVVDLPEVDEKKPELNYMADKLFVYPKKGQSKQQQADDEYACHRYGVEQTGYDPSQPPSNVSTDVSRSQLSEKREDYQRAKKSCLEARGYSVE